MEASYTTNRNKHLPLLIVISACTGLIGLLCLILHVSPEAIAARLADYARHHYLLVGCVCLVVSIYFAKQLDNSVKKEKKVSGLTTVQGMRIRQQRRLRRTFIRMIQQFQRYKGSTYTSNKEILQTGIQPQEVLSSPVEQVKRLADLKRALFLSEKKQQPAVLHYIDGGVKKHTIALLWHVDNENVCLGGGAVLPIQNIYKINHKQL